MCVPQSKTKRNMKKLILTLCAILFTAGISAQETLQLRTHSNPKIEGLLKFADSLGIHIGKSSFDNGEHSQHARHVWFTYSIRADKKYPLTGDADKDKSSQRLNRNFSDQNANMKLLTDSIRQTFIELSGNSQESHMWEYHQDGKDSMSYALAIGSFKNQRPIEFKKYNSSLYYAAPEVITFQYHSDLSKETDIPYSTIGYAFFTYFHTLEDNSQPSALFDTKAYWKTLKKIFDKEGVEKQRLRIYKDSTYTYNPTEVWKGVVNGKGISIKQEIMIYRMQSTSLADKIIREIVDATWAHLDKQPGVIYSIEEAAGFNIRGAIYSTVVDIGSYDPDSQEPHFHISINTDSFTGDHLIFVRESIGRWRFLPKGWEMLKSWKNGKKVYYKKKK